MTLFNSTVQLYVKIINDATTRLANQGGNSVQSKGDAATVATDGVDTHITATGMGTARVETMKEFVPSRINCRSTSNSKGLTDVAFSSSTAALYRSSQNKAVSFSSNGDAVSAKGQLATSVDAFKKSLTGFCDSSLLDVPSDIPCTLEKDRNGKNMTFRFTQPFDAVFAWNSIPADENNVENRAARLFARMAIEPTAQDPVQGANLNRLDGKALSVRRYADIATMNLARSAIDRMVDDRIGTDTTSIQALRMKAWNDANAEAQNAIDRSGNTSDITMDELSIMVQDINKIYFQLFNNIERIAALKAVNLARIIKQNSETGLASGSMSGN